MTQHVTRIAPSPTGDMHLGTARTAYFNWLIARATGGRFILRIDDTDQDRNVQGCIDDILRVMDWLGLDYDAIHYQSQRLDLYATVAQRLLDDGQADYVDGALRFRPDVRRDSWTDQIAGTIAITDTSWSHTEGLVLVRSNGVPTYNFASVIDDIDMGITHVVRGVDHTANTGKQVVLWDHLDAVPPLFSHVGLLFKNKKKLAKRDGVGSMLGLMDAGYDPDAVLDFLLRLGWGPTKDDRSVRVLPRDRALQLFVDGGRMRNTPANVDVMKLDSFDRKYKGRKRRPQTA